MRRHRSLILLASIIAVCLISLVVYDGYQQRRADAVEWRVVRMPLGISAAEAERRIGRPPDRIKQEMGVIAYPATMLAASNSLAAWHGKPQAYEARMWYFGPLTVTVWTDQNDRVALRIVQRPRRGTSWLVRLRRFLKS